MKTPQRDELSNRMYTIFTSMPQDAGLRETLDALASVALAFTHTHRQSREKSLIRALARALQIVEMVDLDEAVRIAAELEGDVAKLVGGPIVLICDPIQIIAPLPQPGGDASASHGLTISLLGRVRARVAA